MHNPPEKIWVYKDGYFNDVVVATRPPKHHKTTAYIREDKVDITATLAAMTQQTARIASMAQTSNDACLRMSARIEELEGALAQLLLDIEQDFTDTANEMQSAYVCRSILAKGN